jgi:hypothetical protein
MFDITVWKVIAHRRKSLRSWGAGGWVRTSGVAKRAGDASSMAAVNETAQPIFSRKIGHANVRYSALSRLRACEGTRRVESHQVASQCNGRAPIVSSYDMDNDGKEYSWWYGYYDDDKDNDGMANDYEQQYGYNYYNYPNCGWQSPLVHNERYGMLVGYDAESGFDHYNRCSWNGLCDLRETLINYKNFDANNSEGSPTLKRGASLSVIRCRKAE